ncbi:hypothetical protein C6361_09700 [Plantactinospora sp. BC1]|nr:hypothetical protein C6361_09700 [Plantactinospora sp. BC1]
MYSTTAGMVAAGAGTGSGGDRAAPNRHPRRRDPGAAGRHPAPARPRRVVALRHGAARHVPGDDLVSNPPQRRPHGPGGALGLGGRAQASCLHLGGCRPAPTVPTGHCAGRRSCRGDRRTVAGLAGMPSRHAGGVGRAAPTIPERPESCPRPARKSMCEVLDILAVVG